MDIMTDKEIITSFLKGSGFNENGQDQYLHDDFGSIHVRQWDCNTVFKQVMELGQLHYAKNLRDILRVQDELADKAVFTPAV